MRIVLFLVALALGCGGSSKPPPGLNDFLPSIPPGTGTGAEAGILTPQNLPTKAPGGDAAKGRPGDYYLENDKIRLLIQAPGRFGETLPYGGNATNLAWKNGGTQFGEIAPFLNVAHTANFTRVEVVRDGRSGGAAVVRALGHAAVLDYFNLASFVHGLGLVGFDTDVPPPLDVAATYVLAPGDTHVRILYTLFNRSDVDQAIAIGSFSDTGGDVEYFTSGVGYGGANYSDLAAIVAGSKPLEFWAGHAPESAYGVLPAPYGLTQPAPSVGLGVAGQAVILYDADTLVSAVSRSNFVIAPKQGRTYETYLFMGQSPGDVHGRVLRLKQKAVGTANVRVVVQGTTTVVPAARVAVMNAQGGFVTTFSTGADGTFTASLEPGSYSLVGDRFGWPRSASVPLTVTAGGTTTAEVALPPTARISYDILDAAGAPLPAKISFVGASSSPQDGRFGDSARLGLARGLVRVQFTRGSGDGPVEVPPGEYRVVVTRGGEYSRFDQRLTFQAGDNALPAVTLHRVLETPGYLAGDFHQHGVNSPDATTPVRERILSYLAAGVEFIGSSDHDYLTDYAPTIQAMGAADLLGSMVGVETTPFDYGHFNAFPMAMNAALPNNGALDWGGGEGGLNKSPGRIFAAMRELGAQVVQVNHPRVPDARRTPLSAFQAYFDRAALAFDLAAGTIFGDPAVQPLPNDVLRIAMDEPLWSDAFDTLEIYNGFWLRDYDGDGVLDDERVDLVLRDWFNFLSLGKVVTPIGNTDTHGYWNGAMEGPRTYVRVPDDTRPGAVRKEDVITGMKDLRDVVVTNGPFLTLHVNGDPNPGMGRIASDADGTVDLTVRIQAPAWMHLGELQIFSNNTYRIPPPAAHDPMAPRRVVRLSETPASGEALLRRVQIAPGAERLEATVEIPGFVLPTPGRDAWIVALVRGTRPLYPMLPTGIPASATIDDLKSGTATGGVFPLAFTSAAFVDRDGNGRYDAPVP